MKNKFWSLALLLTISIMLTACGSNTNEAAGNSSSAAQASAEPSASAATEPPAEAQELTIKHELGETVVKKNPQNVVVFDYGVLDSLDKLGVAVAAVPQANIPPYLSKYESSDYANAGGLKEPDLEQISAVQPELIIISGRQSDYYEELSKIGPTIYLGVDTERYMESYEENAAVLGQIFGKETEVAAELDSVSASIEALNAKVTAADKKALIILANDGSISAYGSGSRFGIIHDVFGFKQADENIEASTHGQSVSFEYVAEKNPDYLFVIDRGAVVTTGTPASKELVENDLVKGTAAYKEGTIVYLDPNYWYLSGGGLLSVEAMIEEVTATVQ